MARRDGNSILKRLRRPGPGSRTRLQSGVMLATLVLAVCPHVSACNIPVFRYALERWKPDVSEIIVFHRDRLEPQEEQFVAQLEKQSLARQGAANVEITRSQIASEKDPALRQLWTSIEEQAGENVPFVVVRMSLGRQGPVNGWMGSLKEAKAAQLLSSPVRQKLSRRLLQGDSVVWLMMRSKDKQKNEAAKKLLTQQFVAMRQSISLPEGVGLPGSELHSDIPLVLKYSIVEFEAADPREQLLARLLTGFQPDAVAAGEPLLVPVFGRGRALEVIPAEQLDGALIEGLTGFLCGACSCQVKNQNPGFDLLISADWEAGLFGEDVPAEVKDSKPKESQALPELLTIPPGRKNRKQSPQSESKR